MEPLYTWFAVLIGFTFSRILEYRHHLRIYSLFKQYPHEEFNLGQKKLFYILPFATIPTVLLEYYLLKPINNMNTAIFALVLILLGLSLRIWSLQSMNWLWCMKTIFVKGMPKIKKGPFKFTPYPEYVSRILDGIGLCLFLGTTISTAMFAVVMVYLLIKIIYFEKNVQREYFAYAEKFHNS